MFAGSQRHAKKLEWPFAAMIVGIFILVSSGYGFDAAQANPSDTDPFLDDLVEIRSIVGGDGRSLYGRPHAPQWKPDGTTIVFPGMGSLWEISAKGGAPESLPITGAQPAFSPDGRWLAVVSGGEIHLWPTEGGEQRAITGMGASTKSMAWSPDSRWIAFQNNRYGSFDLWLVDVREGGVSQLTSDVRYDGYPSWSPDSRTIYFQRLDERWVDHDVLAIPREGGQPTVITRDQDFYDYGSGARFWHPQVSPDGRMVMFPSHRSGWINQWVVPVGGGEPRQLAAEEADQDYAEWSPDGRLILYTSNRNGTIQIRLVSPEGGDSRPLVNPDVGFIRNPTWSPDGRQIAYIMGAPNQPQELYVVSVDNAESRRLTFSTPNSALEREFVIPEKTFYPSADGLHIAAYLYIPPDLDPGERVPAIIRIHGGPTAQYYDHFERNIQYYVRRGYVVLLPNIRGSSGYGREFEHGNDRCWGHCDMEDVVAAAEYLRGLPYVDGANLGIFGRSYGGFMTMAAVTFAPGVFQAAIPRAGYSDWAQYKTHYGGMSGKTLLAYELGPLEENRELYRQLAPLHHVENAMTPTMVIEGAVRPVLHGEGLEPRSTTSIQFAREMERHGKIVTYVSYLRPQDGTVEWPGDKPRMLREKADFFDKYLKGNRIETSPPDPIRPVIRLRRDP
jgi:dipeptidyl aminopeptidase/acylaminoacyl peptidase